MEDSTRRGEYKKETKQWRQQVEVKIKETSRSVEPATEGC